jgi:hypothetical protein
MVRAGARQALARYNPLDFRLERMHVDVQGAMVDQCDGNKLILSGVTRHMRVEASGFDTLRDIVIRVVPLEEEAEAANAAKA